MLAPILVSGERQRLARELAGLEFAVAPSRTNFIFAGPPKFPAEVWLEKLRGRKILVRWFARPETRDFQRIAIRTDAQANALLRAARAVAAQD
jgi:histidinol-phosphate aminotransferase